MSLTPPAERYKSARDALWRIPAREGWAALWRGNGANVLRLVPEVGLKFALNDQMRLLFAPADGRPVGLDGKLAAGATTGVLKTARPWRRHPMLCLHAPACEGRAAVLVQCLAPP